MTTKAYEKFDKTIKRCELMIKDYEHLKDESEQGIISTPNKDIIRGAVVLSVAALDAYVTDAFSERLVPHIKNINQINH